MHRSIYCCAAFMVLVMTGCSIQPDQTPAGESWKQRSAKLGQLEIWRAEGKVALRKADRSESASLSWTQRNNQTDLNLSGPLGFSATKISSDGKTLEINRAGTLNSYDISSRETIAKETGWDLPLQALQHWLKGIPPPATRFRPWRSNRACSEPLNSWAGPLHTKVMASSGAIPYPPNYR